MINWNHTALNDVTTAWDLGRGYYLTTSTGYIGHACTCS